jgi:hypothetical protein
MPARKRAATRPGKTKNVSVSFDAATLGMLRERAGEAHGGNLSAAIAEAAAELHRRVALDHVARELDRGRPPLTEADRRAIMNELEEGWAHARRHARKRPSAA